MIKKIGLSIMSVLLVVVGTVYATIAVYAALNANVKSGGISIQFAASDDLWNNTSKTFYKANVNKLLQKLSGDSTASVTNMTKIDQMATAIHDFDIAGSSAYYLRRNAGADIVVKLGELTWYACYLSKDKQNNTILTLWLTSSQQEAWKNRAADEGEYYGFIDGSLYSDWSADWVTPIYGGSASYLPIVYGTSYLRTVTLNNGGVYALNYRTRSTIYEKKSDSVFSLFTMENQGLTQYIVTPRNVQWQENQELAKEIVESKYNLPNENWSNSMSSTGFNDGYNFTSKYNNDSWADDYIWLPSFTETGEDTPYNNFGKGLWYIYNQYRKNGDLISGSNMGKVGFENDDNDSYNHLWLRSGSYYTDDYSCYLSAPTDSTPQGDYYGGYNYTRVDKAYAVRPALHLNLTKIASSFAT